MAQQGEQPDQGVNLLMPAEMMGGVWANFARVSHSPYEFTIDFARLDYQGTRPTQGIVVQRVSVSPLFVTQLIEALQQNWDKYADKAMPPELRGDHDD